MKMVHIVIFLRILQLPSCWFNTKHAMQHIYNSMYNTRCSTYTLFLICQVYVFSMLELKKKNRQNWRRFPKGWSETTKTTKEKNNSHDILFREVMSLSKMFLDFSDQLAGSHFQLEIFGSNEAVSRERFFMQIQKFPNVPQIWNRQSKLSLSLRWANDPSIKRWTLPLQLRQSQGAVWLWETQGQSFRKPHLFQGVQNSWVVVSKKVCCFWLLSETWNKPLGFLM